MSIRPVSFRAAVVLMTIPMVQQPAQAQTVVPFNGTVVASCVLSVPTSGTLGVNVNSGTEIGSEQPGGQAAVLSIVATGGAPTISFSAPTLSIKPAAYAGTPTVSIRYTSPGGANRSYTSSSSQYTSTNVLGDTVTLNAKGEDSAGFAAGSYRIQTTATCSQ
jgi:hypothetical protein